MSEENKPKSYEEHHLENQRKEEERRQRMEDVRQQTIKRLTNDAAIQDYFKHFNSNSIESFISGYATLKSLFMEYSNTFENIAEKQYTEYAERADKCLEEIQLKKLFDVRCQWGARLIDIDEIETTGDFYVWSEDVLNCPFLTPITKDEFDLYMRYATSDKFEYVEYFNWTELEPTNNASMDDIDFIGWFDYAYNYGKGRENLLLHDERGERESFYRKLWRKEQDEILEKKYESGELQRPVPLHNMKPIISHFNHDHVLGFLQRFEDAATVRLYENYNQYGGGFTSKSNDEDEYLDEQVENIMHSLSFMKDVKLPVKENSDWRKALIDAWKNFEIEQTILHLPAAYDNYLFRIENKIQFSNSGLENHRSLADTVKKQILRGRELNGEPADLNF